MGEGNLNDFGEKEVKSFWKDPGCWESGEVLRPFFPDGKESRDEVETRKKGERARHSRRRMEGRWAGDSDFRVCDSLRVWARRV